MEIKFPNANTGKIKVTSFLKMISL